MHKFHPQFTQSFISGRPTLLHSKWYFIKHYEIDTVWVLTIKLSPGWNAMLRLRNKTLLHLEHSRMKPKGQSLKGQRHTVAQLRRGTQVQRPSGALWCPREPCIIFRKEWASQLYWQHRLHNLGRSDSGGLGCRWGLLFSVSFQGDTRAAIPQTVPWVARS